MPNKIEDDSPMLNIDYMQMQLNAPIIVCPICQASFVDRYGIGECAKHSFDTPAKLSAEQITQLVNQRKKPKVRPELEGKMIG